MTIDDLLSQLSTEGYSGFPDTFDYSLPSFDQFTPTVERGNFGGNQTRNFIPVPGTESQDFGQFDQSQPFDQSPDQSPDQSFDPFASGDAEMISPGPEGRKYWQDTEGTYHPYATEPPPTQAQADQINLLSRRARIRKDILAAEPQKFAPETIDPLTSLGLGVGSGIGGVEKGIGGAIQILGTGLSKVGLGTVGSAINDIGSTSAAAGEQYAEQFTPPEQTKLGKVAFAAGSFAPQLVPVVIGSVLGDVPGASLTIGLLSGGETFRDARNAFIAQGDAVADAETKALPIGVLAGGVSGAIAALFGPVGAAALAKGFTYQAAKSLVQKVAANAGLGALQSGLDAFSRDLVRVATFEPNKPVAEIVSDTIGAAVAGGGVGGTISGLHELGNAMLRNNFQKRTAGQTQQPLSPPGTAGPFGATPQATYLPGPKPVGGPGTGGTIRPPIWPAPKLNRYGKIAAVTLKGMGAWDSTAAAFADLYISTLESEPESLSEFRAGLISAFHDAGLIAEDSLPDKGPDPQGAKERASASNANRIEMMREIGATPRPRQSQTHRAPEATNAPQEQTPVKQSEQPPEETINVPHGTGEADFTGQPGTPSPAEAVGIQLPGKALERDSDGNVTLIESPDGRIFSVEQHGEDGWILKPEGHEGRTYFVNTEGKFFEVKKDLTGQPTPAESTAAEAPTKGVEPYAFDQGPIQESNQPKRSGTVAPMEIQRQNRLLAPGVNEESAIASGGSGLPRGATEQAQAQEVIPPFHPVVQKLLPALGKPLELLNGSIPVFEGRQASEALTAELGGPVQTMGYQTPFGIGTEQYYADKSGKPVAVVISPTLQAGSDVAVRMRQRIGNVRHTLNKIDLPPVEKSALQVLKETVGQQKARFEIPQAIGERVEPAATPQQPISSPAPTPKAAPTISRRARKTAGTLETQKQAIGEVAKRGAKEIKTDLVSQLEQALSTAPNDHYEAQSTGAPKTVAIDIPDDGKFTVSNTKEALGTVLKEAKRIPTDAGNKKPPLKRISPKDLTGLHEELLKKEQAIGIEIQSLGKPTSKSGKQRLASLKQQLAEATKARADYLTAVERQNAAIQAGAAGEILPKQTDANAQESIAPSIVPTAIAQRTLRAKGIAATKQIVTESHLPPATKQMTLAFLNLPMMNEADWSWLETEVKAYDKNGIPAYRLRQLISLSTAAEAADFAHETAHIVYDFLPESYKAVIQALREQALEDRFGSDIPTEFKSGDMTSAQFREGMASGKYDRGDYPLINDSEFYAHLFADNAAAKLWRDRLGKSLWQKIKDWFRSMLDTILRFFKRPPDIERINREVMEGRWKPDPTKIVVTEEQASLSRTAAEAKNVERVVQTPDQAKAQGEEHLAQAYDIVEFLNKHGAATVPPSAQIALGFPDYTQIRRTGETLNGAAANYQAVKAAAATNGRRLELARYAAVQVRDFDGRLDEAISEGATAQKQLASPTHARMVARVNAAKLAADNAEILNKVAASYFDTAFAATQKILQEEKLNDVEIARLEGKLAAIQMAQKSMPAMRQVTSDMVNALSQTANGQALLNNPALSADDIVKEYKAIKAAAGLPTTNDTIISFGAFILAKNAELRDALYAAYLGQQSSIRGALGAYQTQFFANYAKDPVGTLRREMAMAQRRQSMADKTRFTWLQMNKALFEHDAPLLAKVEAGQVATKIKGDPDWKLFSQDVYADTVAVATQKAPFIPYSDRFMDLPDGTNIDLGISRLVGDNTGRFNPVYQEFAQADQKLEAWLMNPANRTDPDYQRHLLNRENLRNHFYSLAVLKPTDPIGVFEFAMTQPRAALAAAGGRVAAGAMKAMADWNLIRHRTSDWATNYGAKFNASRIASINARKIKHRMFGDSSFVAANRQYYGNVMNYIAWNHSQPTGHLATGDLLPDGSKILPTDMADLRQQAMMLSKGFEMLGSDQYSKDTMSKFGLWRMAHKFSENTVVRTPHWDWKEQLADPFTEARKRYREADKAGNVAQANAAEQDMVRLLNEVWNNRLLGASYVINRDPDFVKATVYDGPAGPFAVVGNQMRTNAALIQSFDALVNAFAALSGHTPDEVRKTLLIDFGNSIENFAKAAEDEGGVILPKTDAQGNLIESKNPTTRTRDKAIAPFAFYDYGLPDSHAVARFAGAVHSRASDKLAAALQATINDLTRIEKEFARKVQAGQAPKALMKANKLAVMNEQTYDRLTKIRWRKVQLQNVLNSLTSYDPTQDLEVDPLRYFTRAIGTNVGLLVSGTRTTLRNPLWGWPVAGYFMNRLSNVPLLNYPAALFWVNMRTVQTLASVGYGIARGISKSTLNIPRAVWDLVRGKPRDAIDRLFRDYVDEIGQKALMRVGTTMELANAGLLTIPDFSQEFSNKVLGDWLYEGKVMRDEMAALEKVGMAGLSPFEFLLAVQLRPLNPTFGDVSLNIGDYDALRYPLGPVWQLERALKSLVLKWQRNPWRTFDFNNPKSEQNILSPHEIYPGWALLGKLSVHTLTEGADLTALNDTRRIFKEAGLGSFDEMAARFMGEINRGNKAARLLTPLEMQRLGVLMIDLANRPSAAGEARLFTQKNMLTSLVKPFQQYRLRTLINLKGFTGGYAASPGSNLSPSLRRLLLWSGLFFSTGLAFLFSNATAQTAAEYLDRWFALLGHKMEKPSRLPSDMEGGKSQALAWARYALGGVPYVDTLANAMLTDIPQSANMTMNVAMVEKGQDLVHYAGGVIQTGNPMYGLPEMVGSFVPDSRVIFNRLESQSGTRMIRNVSNLIRRNGPVEQLRPMGGSIGGENMSDLTPYGRAMGNAAANGDIPEVVRLYNEAVQIASQRGIEKPEQRVKQMFVAQNPYTKALKAPMTADQRQEFKNKLSTLERGEVELVEQNMNEALSAIGGREMHFEKQQREAAQRSLGISRLVNPPQRRNPPGFRMPNMPRPPRIPGPSRRAR